MKIENTYFFKANSLNSVNMNYVFGMNKNDAIKTLEEKMKQLKKINLQEKYLVVHYEKPLKNGCTESSSIGFSFNDVDYKKPADEILELILKIQ